MKFLLMTHGDRAALADRSRDWVDSMIAFTRRLDDELRESGELLIEQGLADPSEALVVRPDGVVEQRPFHNARDSLAGFWVVDVVDLARAVAIAQQMAEGMDGVFEVRACADAPPDA